MDLTKEQCLEQGGHCWVDQGWSVTNGYTSSGDEYCKHCPTRRKWVSQPSRKYEEYDAKAN